MTSIRRGTLLSFDPATWTAMVMLEGADMESQIPVGQWVPPAMLAADCEVAVIVFDATNTDDGVVLGAYGALGAQNLRTTDAPTFDALNLGSASGAATGDIQAASTAADHSTTLQLAGGTGTGSNVAQVNFYANRGAAIVARLEVANDGANAWGKIALYTAGGSGLVAALTLDHNQKLTVLNVNIGANQVVGPRKTGWAAWTGTPTRTSKATSTATLANVAEALKALIDDLISHGLIGT